jgi:hypothetical protein
MSASEEVSDAREQVSRTWQTKQRGDACVVGVYVHETQGDCGCRRGHVAINEVALEHNLGCALRSC